MEGCLVEDEARRSLATFVQALMGAEADAVCGALYGQRSPERVNRRNGSYRARDFDTRVGTWQASSAPPPSLDRCKADGAETSRVSRPWPSCPIHCVSSASTQGAITCLCSTSR